MLIRKFDDSMSILSSDVTSHVESGIENFAKLIDVLQNEEVIDKTSAKRIVKLVRPCIKDIYISFLHAKNKCETQVDALQRQIEEISQSIGHSKNKINDIREEIKEVNIQVDGLKEKENNQDKYLKDCESILRDKESCYEKTVQKLEDAKENQKIVAITGAAVTAIPFIGWVAGPIMMIVSFTALETAITNARDTTNNARSTRDTTAHELEGVRSKLTQLNQEIHEKKRQNDSLEEEERELQQQKSNLVADISKQGKLKEQLNHIFTFLSTAFGRARHLKHSTRNFDHHWSINIFLRIWDRLVNIFSGGETVAHQIIDFQFIQQLVNPMKDLAEHLVDRKSRTYLTMMGNFEVHLKKLESVSQYKTLQIKGEFDDYC